MKLIRNRRRNKKAAVLAESAAAMALFLPLTIFITFVGVEVSHVYLIKSALSEGAREAARSLAIAYGLDSSMKGNRGIENQKAFDHIRMHNIINSSDQFADPVWNTAADPPTVTCTVRYASDQFGLPHFPNPDPLHLGDNFLVTGTATYRLQ
jgi:hypothetical protein